MNIRSQVQIGTPRTTPQDRAGSTNGSPTVSEHVQDTIGALIRAGGMDTLETEQIALATLRDLCRLTARQAENLWIQYTSQVHPA